ncbi:hypothetical protein ACMYUJ_17290 [Stutzerimonas zhaodongensis]|uniref:hypothetical protein n=1 Tax=Stutzerimonas zhaodongensis TaxID=1176257 RepID=UPI0039EFB997
MSRSIPICEALAADPARYMFQANLEWLKKATDYPEQHLQVNRLQGHLVGLFEAGAITFQTFEAAYAESHAFVWGPPS